MTVLHRKNIYRWEQWSRVVAGGGMIVFGLAFAGGALGYGAMTAVSRSISSLRTPAAYIGWLFVTVRRACSRLARSMRRVAQPIDDYADKMELSERPEAELRFDLASAIQSLPAHYRTILLLRDIEEFSIGEIADHTGLSREATKARLRRARLMIREYLAD